MRLQKLINEVYETVHGIFHNLGHLYQFLIFIIPFLTIALYFVFVFDYLSPEQANKYAVATLAYFFPPLGKETIIPFMLASGESITLPNWLSWVGTDVVGPSLPVWVAMSMIIVMDMITSIILAYNWWFGELIITHIPILNRAYARLKKKSQKLRKKKLLIASLLVFMIIPFQGTGSISTTIIARALTIPVRKTVFIVFVGSFVTTTLLTLVWLGFFKFL